MKKREVESFINDIIKVYEKHGMSISHEDSYGAFLIENYNPKLVEWLRASTKYMEDLNNKKDGM